MSKQDIIGTIACILCLVYVVIPLFKAGWGNKKGTRTGYIREQIKTVCSLQTKIGLANDEIASLRAELAQVRKDKDRLLTIIKNAHDYGAVTTASFLREIDIAKGDA